jgi:hypothetical protein
MASYEIKYNKPSRNPFGPPAGWYATLENSSRAITLIAKSEQEAVRRAEIAIAKMNEASAISTTPATPVKAPQVDRSATRVANMIGLSSPKATGRCHYCGLPLTHGRCEECV